jgi:predicted nucleic acid-binding protein
MGVVIDTGVFVHWERRRRAIDQHLVKFDRPAFISVVTASELLVGVHRADTPTRRKARSQFVEAILSHLPIRQVSLTIARQHAELSADWASEGSHGEPAK